MYKNEQPGIIIWYKYKFYNILLTFSLLLSAFGSLVVWDIIDNYCLDLWNI